MDGKRKINPQNPARKIRGRKQKKSLRQAPNLVVQGAPTQAAASPAASDE
ncbi:MAG TPA: hypothetical protein VNL35_15210 [Chloroflexota bacterium]|nr:hypothetical protein [Chloroflexota bacterium]